MVQNVKLPCSAKRGASTFLKLVRRVRLPAQSGFDFEGVLLKPGQVASWAELRPNSSYPEVPVLLECAGIAVPGWGHKRSEYLYLVWQWSGSQHAGNAEAGSQWTELARCLSRDWDWAPHLAPVVHDAIEDQADAPDLGAIAGRLRQYLDFELERVPASERLRLLGVVHDELAVRLSGGGGWVPSTYHLPPPLSITTRH